MKKFIVSMFMLQLGLLGCSSEKKANQSEDKVLNKAKSEREILHQEDDTLNFIAKPGVHLNNVKINQDTLVIVSEDNIVYFPFGEFKNINDFEKNYPIFKKTVEIDIKEDSVALYRMMYDNSFIKFFEDDETNKLQIVSAEITSPKIKLFNHISIGATKQKVLSDFFDSISLDEENQINIVEIESVVLGIKYYYEFRNNALASVSITSAYVFNKN